MSRTQVLTGGALLAAVGLAAACATVGVSVTGHAPKTHERYIFLKKKTAGGCTVKDKLGEIKAHKVDDITWRVKNDCDEGTHKVEILMKKKGADPLDSTCVRYTDVKDKWERISCAIGSQAQEGVTYYYNIFVDGALEQDPEIEIYP